MHNSLIISENLVFVEAPIMSTDATLALVASLLRTSWVFIADSDVYGTKVRYSASGCMLLLHRVISGFNGRDTFLKGFFQDPFGDCPEYEAE